MKNRPVPTLLIATVFFALGVMPASAAPPGSGKARGNLVVDGKPIALRYAVAVTGPDTFDATKEAVLILLTPDPVAADSIRDATSFDALRHLVKEGLVLKVREQESFHLTIRHPVLAGKELQTSGGASMMKGVTITADAVSGEIAPFMGKEEKIFEHVVEYPIAFNAPIMKHIPLEIPIVLGPNPHKLGPGGGEPGKAWLNEKCKAPVVLPDDPKGVEAYMRKEGLLKQFEDEAKKQGHTVTRAEIDDLVKQFGAFAKLGAALATTKCKVLGGAEDGKAAILQVEAFSLGSMGRTEITLVKENNAWKVKKEGAWSALP